MNTGFQSCAQLFAELLDEAFGPETAEPLLLPSKRVRIEAPPAKVTLKVAAPAPTAPLTRSFLDLREEQVKLMSAGATPTKTLRGNWPVASDKTQRLFAERHDAYKTYSAGYMRSQERFLFLLDVLPDERFLRFERECYHRALAPTTAHCYWVAFATLDKIMSPACGASPAVQRVASILEARVWLHPVAFPHPLTADLRKLFSNTFSSRHFGIVALVEACWALGQRFSDFIQLAVSDFIIRDKTVLITFRRGKTIVHTKPYSLSLDRHCRVTENLLEVRSTALSRGWLFLTSQFNDASSTKALSQRTTELLTQLDERLEIRSIRRGGLQHMASLGHQLPQMRLFSKHRSDEMLLRYLNWGQAAEALNEEILQVSTTMTAACN
jgi:integrase